MKKELDFELKQQYQKDSISLGLVAIAMSALGFVVDGVIFLPVSFMFAFLCIITSIESKKVTSSVLGIIALVFIYLSFVIQGENPPSIMDWFK